jgi:hypothetical protein
MNKNPAKAAIFTILTVFLALQAFAQPVAPAYPYLIVTPPFPAAGKDLVTVKVVLGTAGNSCMAPTFTDEKFTIVPSMLAIYPPRFGVTVTYTTIPVPPGTACNMLYAPVQFGPVFTLGQLFAGVYTINDSGRVDGTFTVAAQGMPNAGSISWNGATFTTATDKAVYYPTDSLAVRYTVTNNTAELLSYGTFGGNCIYDLIVSLKGGPELYRRSTNAACDKSAVTVVVNPGATIANDFPKLGYPAGVDAYVAALDSVVLTVSAQFWGTKYDSTKASVDITVKKQPLEIQSFARSMATRGSAYFASTGQLSVCVPSRQKVSVSVFTTDGRVLPGISFSKYLGAGTHVIPLNQAINTGGILIIKVKGETFGSTIKMISGITR